MNRFRRRIFFAVVVIVLIAVALVGWLYVPTRNALLRAEGFQFRRMLVTRTADEAYRFFFVTNRALESGNGKLEDRFRNERQELRFGSFDTHIEPTLGIGMIINPSAWFQDEEIKLSRVQPLDRDPFVDQLREQVRDSPHGSLLVTINGFREQFPSALRKTAFLAHVLDIDSPVLVFDWPGDQGSTLRGYRRAQRLAEESGEDLAHTLRLVIREVRPRRLWLIANSMAGEVVAHAFSDLYLEADLADAETEIEDVVLTAPDVDHARFNQEFRYQIAALADDLTVYVSSNDRALLMSRLINRARRLGESTLDTSNPDQSDEALAVFQLLEANDEVVDLVDVTPINRTRNFHNFSLETPEFFDDLYLLLTNEGAPRSRLRYRLRTPDGRVYWVLTRSR